MKRDLIFYYGTETPALVDSLSLKDTYIVLQDYHPVVQQGVYEDYFPHSERFLYWNSCKLPKTLCDLPPEELAFAEYQVEWDCYILDLTRPLHQEILISKAEELMSFFGVHGLFVDDLDVWANNPRKQVIMLDFLDQLESRLPADLTYIFNRGFPFWSKKSEKLRAVVVEDVGPATSIRLEPLAQNWLYNTLQMHVTLLLHKAPHVSIIFLEYGDHQNSVDFIGSESENSLLPALFDTYNRIDSIVMMTSVGRKLDLWPRMFQAAPNSMEFLNS